MWLHGPGALLVLEACLLGSPPARSARGSVAFAPPLIHFIPDSLTDSVPLFLKRPCVRNPRSAPIVAKLRGAGVDIFRYVLDHPLVNMADNGMETSVHATRIAALVRKS